MNYYELPEWPAFLAAIRAAPDDDLPRLVAADWLDELETEVARQRAEFIRVQCEIKRIRKPVFRKITGEDPSTIPDPLVQHHAKLRTREHEVLDWFCREDMAGHFGLPNHEGIHPTLHGLICPSRGCEFGFDRGFVTRVSAPLAVLHGERCRCMEYTRLTGPCDCCHGTGRTAGVLGELLRREPITAAGIEVTQASPVGVVPNEYLRSGTGPDRNWAWGLSVSTQYDCYMIPRDVWDLMPPTTLTDPRGRYKVFLTADAARLALGESLFRLHGPKSEVTT